MANLTRNPYFNDDPQLFYWSLKILAIVSTIFAGICFYTVTFKSPSFLSRTFVKLLLYHGAIAYLALITVCCLSMPMYYLPYMCIKYVGPLSDLGMPSILQTGIIGTLLMITLYAVVPLFYYRMDAILPRGHILNSKFLRFSMYSFIYVASPPCPIPILYFALNYEDQNELKRHLLQSTGVYYEDFMSDRVIVTHFGGSNPFTYLIFTPMFLFSFVGIISVIVSSYIILKLTSKVGIVGSEKYKAHQRQLFMSLAAMTVVFLVVLGVLLPGLASLIVFNSYRIDILNAIVFVSMLAIPLAFVAYVITYKPYRQFLLKPFVRKKGTVTGSSTAFTVSRHTLELRRG